MTGRCSTEYSVKTVDKFPTTMRPTTDDVDGCTKYQLNRYRLTAVWCGCRAKAEGLEPEWLPGLAFKLA